MSDSRNRDRQIGGFPMHRSIFLLFLIAVLPGQAMAVSGDEESYSPGEKRILEEVQALKKAVEALEKRLSEIEKRLEDSEGRSPTEPPFLPRGFRRGDQEKFKGITLPEKPTKEQVREYVRKIMDASRGQRMFSTNDPQIELLMAIPGEHRDVLFEAIGRENRGLADYHVLEALKQLASEDDIPLIRKLLPYKRGIVAIVIARGWEKKVEDVLVRELDDTSSFLPCEWITAVANLRNPSTYARLLRFLVDGPNPHMTIEAIESIPDFPRKDFEKAVKDLWKKRNSDSADSPPCMEFGKVAVAKAAAKIGCIDALEYCILKLNEKKASAFDGTQDLRPFVLRLVPVQFSNRELQNWFEENGDKLFFNRETGKYEIGKGVEEDY